MPLIRAFVADDVEIKGNITVKTRRHNPEKPANPLPGVKNIIGISSGKGGASVDTYVVLDHVKVDDVLSVAGITYLTQGINYQIGVKIFQQR